MSTVSIPAPVVQPTQSPSHEEIISGWLIENSAEAVELLNHFRELWHGDEVQAVQSLARSLPFVASRCWGKITTPGLVGSMILILTSCDWSKVATAFAARLDPRGCRSAVDD